MATEMGFPCNVHFPPDSDRIADFAPCLKSAIRVIWHRKNVGTSVIKKSRPLPSRSGRLRFDAVDVQTGKRFDVL